MPGKVNASAVQQKNNANGTNQKHKSNNKNANTNSGNDKKKVQSAVKIISKRKEKSNLKDNQSTPVEPSSITASPVAKKLIAVKISNTVPDVSNFIITLNNFNGTTGRYRMSTIMNYMPDVKDVAIHVNDYEVDDYITYLNVPDCFKDTVYNSVYAINDYVNTNSTDDFTPFLRNHVINKYGDIRTDVNIVKKLLAFLSWHIIIYHDGIYENKDMATLNPDLFEAVGAYYILTKLYTNNTEYKYSIPTAVEFFDIHYTN